MHPLRTQLHVIRGDLSDRILNTRSIAAATVERTLFISRTSSCESLIPRPVELLRATGREVATELRGENDCGQVAIDGSSQEAKLDELLIDLINRTGGSIPHSAITLNSAVQTCDTCMVEMNGRLVRACASAVADGMNAGHGRTGPTC